MGASGWTPSQRLFVSATHAHNRAISRDPDVFPNPDQFDPQRWLDKKGQIRTDLKFYPYGHGRRYVPYHLQPMHDAR